MYRGVAEEATKVQARAVVSGEERMFKQEDMGLDAAAQTASNIGCLQKGPTAAFEHPRASVGQIFKYEDAPPAPWRF